MRQKRTVLVTILLFAAGISVLMYPLVSEWYNNRNQTTVAKAHKEAVAEIKSAELTALREAAMVYNEGLFGNVILIDPFDERMAEESLEEYNNLLNVSGDGVMGSVRIPNIDVVLPIYHGTSAAVLEKGAGHLEKTSLPVGGIGTHAVISAHTGHPTATLFTELDKLKEGALFFLEVLDETLAYRVDQIKVVEPSDTSDLPVNREEDFVTLVTCTPYGINSHRLLVRGRRTDYVERLEEEAVQGAQTVAWNWPYIVAGIIFVLILLAYIIYRRRKI